MNFRKRRAFIHAVKMGDVPIVERLLHADVDIHTALTWAARTGRLEITRLLLEARADVHHGQALKSAAKIGHLELVDCLLSAGADPNARALISAAFHGHLKVTQRLLEAKADVHIPRREIISSHEDMSTIHTLLNTLHQQHDNALYSAASMGHLDVVTCLLEHGAAFDPDWKYVSPDVRQFCLDFEPVFGPKSAAKLT